MANEAVLKTRLEDPINFVVGDNAAIEKGAFLRLLDGRTASGASLIAAPCAGIAAREKVAGDGRTRLAVFRKGIFDVHASGAIAIGAPVQMAENNDVMVAPITSSGATIFSASGAIIIGHALEAASDNETFEIYLNI